MKRGTILIVLLLLFSIACGGPGGGKGQSKLTKVDVYKGTKALEMKFLDNAPPKDVFELQRFPVGLQLSNDGASDITRGHLTITLENQYMEAFAGEDSWDGLDGTTFRVEGDPNLLIFNLYGKTIESPSPKISNIFRKISAKEIDVQSPAHTSRILATACYEYRTYARPELCLDPDIYGLSLEEKPCQMKDVSLSSQGAPVALTKVEPRMLPAETVSDEGDKLMIPSFNIYFQNKGNGEVVYSTKIDDACSGKALSYSDYNTYELDVKLNNIPLECAPSPFRLEKGRDHVRCYATGGNFISANTPAYSSILEINLRYGYTTTISKDVEIKRDPSRVLT